MAIQKAMQPKTVVDFLSKYIQEGDLEGITTLFHPDYLLLFPPTEAPKRGAEALKEVFTGFIEGKLKLIGKVTGEVINGDTALVQVNWHVEDVSGAVVSKGSSTEVHKQLEDGSWVYYIDCPLGLPAIEELVKNNTL